MNSAMAVTAYTISAQAQARQNRNMERVAGSMFTYVFELRVFSLVLGMNLAMALVPFGAANLH